MKLYIKENNENTDELISTEQEFTSKSTAHGNGKANGGMGRVPALFKNNNVTFRQGTLNLDYGCGEYTTSDRIAEFLEDKGVTYVGYDKYNRTSSENNEAIKEVRQNGGADTVTCANVLNVIKERDVRVNEVINNIYSLLKSGGTAYFDVYEDKKKEGPKQTGKDKYQLFKGTTDYFDEVAEIFGENNVQVKGKVIIARK